MTASSPFGVVGVDRPSSDGRNRVFNKSALVDGIGVNRNLDVVLVPDREAGIDRRRRRSPVLVQFQSTRACFDLMAQRITSRAISLSEEPDIDRQMVSCLEHATDVPRSWGTRRGVRPGRRPRTATEHRRDPRRDGLIDLLWADEMDMAIDAAGGDDLP